MVPRRKSDSRHFFHIGIFKEMHVTLRSRNPATPGAGISGDTKSFSQCCPLQQQVVTSKQTILEKEEKANS